MTWSIVAGQTASLSNATTQNPTLSLTSAITSGNIYCGGVCHDSAQTLNSITDDKGNTYNLPTVITDTTDGIACLLFWLGGITNGPKTLTFNFSAVTNSMAVVAEVTSSLGATVSDPHDVAVVGQFQASVASGANNMTSTNMTTLTNGDFILGLLMDGQNGVTAPTAGTSPVGYTSIGTAVHATDVISMRLEWASQAAAGAIAATGGIATNNDPGVTMVVGLVPPVSGDVLMPQVWT